MVYPLFYLPRSLALSLSLSLLLSHSLSHYSPHLLYLFQSVCSPASVFNVKLQPIPRNIAPVVIRAWSSNLYKHFQYKQYILRSIPLMCSCYLPTLHFPYDISLIVFIVRLYCCEIENLYYLYQLHMGLKMCAASPLSSCLYAMMYAIVISGLVLSISAFIKGCTKLRNNWTRRGPVK